MRIADSAFIMLAACSSEPVSQNRAATVDSATSAPTGQPVASALVAQFEQVASEPPGIDVPRVIGLPEPVAARINAALDQERQEVVNGREACVRAAGAADKSHYALKAVPQRNGGGLLSFRMDGDAYCGGANGSTLTGAKSFDLTSGEEIDVIPLAGLTAEQLGELARPYYRGSTDCAALFEQSNDMNQLVTVSAAYPAEDGLGVVYSFNAGAAEGCGSATAVIPRAVLTAAAGLRPPLDRL